MKKIIILVIVMLSANIVFAQNAQKVDGNESAKLSNLKNRIVFIENKGQIHDTEGNPRADVLFMAKLSNMTVYFQKDEISFVLYKPADKSAEGEDSDRGMKKYRYDLKLVGSNAKVMPNDMTTGKYNYLMSGKKITNVRGYRKLTYRNLYPNIDMVFHSTPEGLKYDFFIKPNGNVSDIKFKYDGLDNITINDGKLLLHTPLGKAVEKIPASYELLADQDNKRIETPCSYNVNNNIVSFNVSRQNKNNHLVIDPVLSWDKKIYSPAQRSELMSLQTLEPFQSSESDYNYGGGGAVYDSEGNLIVTGHTTIDSEGLLFDSSPTLHDEDILDDTWDVYVIKYSPNGDAQWVWYIHGSEKDLSADVDVDDNDSVYVIGTTHSNDLNQIGGNVIQSSCQSCTANSDIFVFNVGPDGNPLKARITYLGGSNTDIAHRIKVDENDDLLILGETLSSDFPVYNAWQSTCASCPDYPDAFVGKISNDLSLRHWITFYGGSLEDNGLGLDIDNDNDVLVAGATRSPDLFLLNRFQSTLNRDGNTDNRDAFISKFANSNCSLMFSSYMGGNDDDFAQDIKQIDDFELIIAGYTKSNHDDEEFPLFPSYDDLPPVFNKGNNSLDVGDAFFAHLPEFTDNHYDIGSSHYIGGTDQDGANDIIIDRTGQEEEIYITGYTNSDDFFLYNSFQNQINKGLNTIYSDAFIVKLRTPNDLMWSTYFSPDLDTQSGQRDDIGIGLGFDGNNDKFAIAGNYDEVLENELDSNSFVFTYDVETEYPFFFGGSSADQCKDVHTDNNDYTYITGSSQSSDFPTTTGVIEENSSGGDDIVISKFNFNGDLQFSTYYSGENNDVGKAIYSDCYTCDIYVTGHTNSPNLDYSVSPYVVYQTYNGNDDAFLMRLNSDGTSLRYFTYYGTQSDDGGEDISLRTDNAHVYITGYAADQLNIVNGYQSTYGGGTSDAFVADFDANGSLTWSSYLGGSDNESGKDMRYFNNLDRFAIVGYTNSNDFPISGNGWGYRGATDIFFSSFSSNNVFEYCSYYGGPSNDKAYGVTKYNGQFIYFTGYTESSHTNFEPSPVIGQYDSDKDAYVSRLEFDSYDNSWISRGSRYVSYGENTDISYDVKIDNNSDVYITGFTNSAGLEKHGLSDDLNDNYIGDAFVCRFDKSLQTFHWLHYYGDSEKDEGMGLGIDHLRNIVVGGNTFSSSLPEANGTYQGSGDMFMVKMDKDEGYLKIPSYENYEVTGKQTMEDVRTYPNPVKNELNIKCLLNKKGMIKIDLVNLNGEKIISYQDITNKGEFTKTIGVNDIPSGTYYLRLLFGKEYYYMPIVKVD